MATGWQWWTGAVSTVGDGTDLREKAVNPEENHQSIINRHKGAWATLLRWRWGTANGISTG